jgi:DNA-binding protein H-NS
MASPNYDKMSMKELLDHQARIQKAIASAKSRERDEIKQKVTNLLAQSGFSVGELFGGRVGAKSTKGSKVAPKYINPDNKSETWTGRGRQPRWLAAKLAKGGKLQDFAI